MARAKDMISKEKIEKVLAKLSDEVESVLEDMASAVCEVLDKAHDRLGIDQEVDEWEDDDDEDDDDEDIDEDDDEDDDGNVHVIGEDDD